MEERAAQGVAAGLDPEEADRRARVEVGGVAAMAQKLREQRSGAPLRRWLGDLVRDVRYALRQGCRAPAVPLVAVLTLGLGIGGAAAMFGLIQGVLLTPPPYADPARLVLLAPARVDGVPYDRRPTTAQWLAWRDAARDVDLALYHWTFNFLVRDDGSQSMGGMVVTPDYFKVMGLVPVRGRTFLESEAASGGPPTAIILGYELWQRSFHGDPGHHRQACRGQPDADAVASRRRDASGRPLPAGPRRLPTSPGTTCMRTVDFWVPARADESQLQARGWNVVGRLGPGASASRTAAAVAGATAASVPRTRRWSS